MTAYTLTTSQLFNGQEWHGPCTLHIKDGLIGRVTAPLAAADLTAQVVMPGLVDYGVSVTGYQERPDAERPFAPEEAFGLLCLRYGVTTVVDLANSWSTIAYFNVAGRSLRFPRMLYGGARLCTDPGSRHDVAINDNNCERIVKGQAEWGASFLSLGEFHDVSLLGRMLHLAQELRLPLAWSGQGLEPSGCFWTWPHVTPAGAWTEGAAAIADVAAYFAPCLEAAHRSTIEGLLEADFAHLASPVIPYARNFARMSGFVGRRVGRRVLESLYGERLITATGDQAEELARGFAEHGACLAASGAVRAGVVPGLSLWYEIDRLAVLLGDNEAALRCAGTAGSGLWPQLGLGRIEPGGRADLLLFDQIWNRGSIRDLLSSLRAVIAGGESYEIERLEQELQSMVKETLKEAI